MSIPPTAPAPLPAPLLPPDYSTLTDEAVQSGVSFAHSHFNPRGLEKAWNAAWAATFHGLTSPFRGSFLVHPAYPLWISATEAAEMELRRGFDDFGMDFDDVQLGLQPVPEDQADEPDPMDLDGTRRKSRRVIVRKQQDNTEAERKRVIEGNALLAKRNKHFDQQLDDLDYQSPWQDGASEVSHSSRAEKGALDREPDFVINHIASCPLPEPKTKKERKHYRHRAGRKVFHTCTTLIFELKVNLPRKPAKDEDEDDQENDEDDQLENDDDSEDEGGGPREPALWRGWEYAMGIRQLLEYCAVHFVCNPGAAPVIAMLSAGPVWRWVMVAADEVPKWDFAQRTAEGGGEEKEANFHTKLGAATLFRLRTPASDQELTHIRNNYFLTKLADGHTPPAP